MFLFKHFRPDLIVALLAVLIGLCTMFVYIYQARIMSKQIHAATWPYLEIIFSNTGNSFSINVKNKGAGPAIVKNALVRVDDVIYQDTQANLDSIAFLLTGSHDLLNGYTNVNNRVMSPGEVINFIEVTDSTSVKLILQGLRKHSVHFEICFCSVFEECWKAADGKVEPCESCALQD
jgi:hypothetical protein